MISDVLDERTRELEKLITEKLKPMNGKVFYLMVNYSLLEWHNNKLGCCKFEEGSNGNAGKLKIGYLSRVNGKTKLIPDLDMKNSIFLSALNLEFDGIDCLKFIKDFVFEIEVNSELRLINIINSGYKQLSEAIYSKTDARSATSNLITPTGENVSHSEAIQLYNYFDRVSFINYSTLINRRVLKFLKRNNTVYQNGITPMFYRTLSQWVPVFVTGKCIFNPFLEAVSNYTLLEGSELYDLAKNHVEEFNGFKMYYLTNKSICGALNFKKVISCDAYFLSNLLGGFFQETLPRKNSFIYISREGSFINQDSYSKLSLAEKKFYSPRSTLFLLCNSCIRRTNLNKVNDFYEVVKNSKIKKKVINNE